MSDLGKLIADIPAVWTGVEIYSRRARTAWVVELSRLDSDAEIFATGRGADIALALAAALEKAR